jgi:DNA-binding GntR family transcriptional regulator
MKCVAIVVAFPWSGADNADISHFVDKICCARTPANVLHTAKRSPTVAEHMMTLASPSPIVTDTERAVDQLRSDIIHGALKPDTKLKIRELKAHYGLGASPLREALAQLSAQGIVSQSSQRGFRVPSLTAAHLDDITRSRQLIEGEALRLAIEAGRAGWEAEIVASFHLLERSVAEHAQRRKPLGEAYEAVHHRFHKALIAACPLDSLKTFSDLLYINASR